MDSKTGTGWKTVRVFISSTFRDFHAERDYLVKYVFPELRQWCEQWRLHLVDIDLRWGVTREEAESGKVIDICLENVDGARPFFLCMLGGRYGWVPDSASVPDETYAAYEKLRMKTGLSITHMEIMHAVFEPLDMSGDKMMPDAFFYFRDDASMPLPEELEGFNETEKSEYVRTFFEEDAAGREKLTHLKNMIADHFSADAGIGKNRHGADFGVFTYKPVFDPDLRNPEDNALRGRFMKESLVEFGRRVKADVQRAISLRYADRITAVKSNKEDDPLVRERDYQESFVEKRTMLFTGRKGLLERLYSYVTSDSRRILAVYGEAGSGKSSLLASFFREISGVRDGAGRFFVIPHFVGASPESASPRGTLRRLCLELKERFSITDDIPSGMNRLAGTFRLFLDRAETATVILIDGLNQLDENDDSHSLSWLPSELPPNVKIIASALEGRAKNSLRTKTDLELDIPVLTQDERVEIIRLMPGAFCKSFEPEHMNMLLKKRSTENPLYLRVAIEELRVFGSFEKLGDMIDSLPDGVVELFVYMLDRLSCDHTPGIVERLFCLLECSRYGLTIGELADLMEDTDPDMEHRVILRGIREYMHNRGELIDFFHRSLSKAVRMKYFS